MAPGKFKLSLAKHPINLSRIKSEGIKPTFNLAKSSKPFFLNFVSLRFKLIGWYLLLLILTLAIFSIYIFFQFRNLEQNQQDRTLEVAASQIQALVQPDHAAGGKQSLSIRNLPSDQPLPGDINRSNTQVRIFNASGELLDSSGALVSQMPIANLSAKAAFTTLATSTWRLAYFQPADCYSRQTGRLATSWSTSPFARHQF